MLTRGLNPGDNYPVILEREGYYPVINDYRNLFIDSGERYWNGSTLDEVYTLFVMGRRLRAVLFRHITLAEALLKSVCCYEFCSRHPDDNEAYLNPVNYRHEQQFRRMVVNLIDNMNTTLGRNPQKRPMLNKDYLKHYITKHDNVPLWVTMNSLTLGQAFTFYTLLNESTRFSISQRFQTMFNGMHGNAKLRITHKSIQRSYDHIKDFRNICAHDERLFCARVDKSKSTDFARLMLDFYAVLTPEQCRSLLNGIRECIDFATNRIDTVSEKEILSSMGFSSRNDIESRLLEGHVQQNAGSKANAEQLGCNSIRAQHG